MISDVEYIATVTMDVTRSLVLARCVTLAIWVTTVLIVVRKIVIIIVIKLMELAPGAGATYISAAFAMFLALKSGQTVRSVDT